MKEHSRNAVLDLVGLSCLYDFLLKEYQKRSVGMACFIDGSLCLIFKITTFFFFTGLQNSSPEHLSPEKKISFCDLVSTWVELLNSLFEIKRCLVLFVVLFVLYHLLGSCNHEDVVNSQVHVYSHCMSQKANVHLQNGKMFIA